MKLLEYSLDLVIMIIFKKIKNLTSRTAFLKSLKNSREVTGYSFNHVSYTLCILEIAPI